MNVNILHQNQPLHPSSYVTDVSTTLFYHTFFFFLLVPDLIFLEQPDTPRELDTKTDGQAQFKKPRHVND
jgi:hypothetical protein